MRIVVDYHSCWQASFLDGSDQEPLPKNKKREFNASTKSTKEGKEITITKDTIMGILCRLIGDQRKLYQTRAADDYYFKDIEPSISFRFIIDDKWGETVSIINKKQSRPPQSNYVGLIDSDTGLFSSEQAPILWSVLFLDIEGLIDFINSNSVLNQQVYCNPTRILDRISIVSSMEKIETRQFVIESKTKLIEKAENKLKELKNKTLNLVDTKKADKLKQQIRKQVEFVEFLKRDLQAICEDQKLFDADEVLQQIIKFLSEEFSQEYLEKDYRILPIRLYAAALYLQLNRMQNSDIDISELINDKDSIQGFSKRGFNGIRDFINPFSTSVTNKKTTNTPANITKASGQLEINLDIEQKKAKELKTMIDNAGVSSFYLGKKGLAYVSRIRL